MYNLLTDLLPEKDHTSLVADNVDDIVNFVKENPGVDYMLMYINFRVTYFSSRSKSCSCIGSILLLPDEKPEWGRVVLELLKRCPEIKGVKIGGISFDPTQKALRSYFDTYLEILRSRKLLYFEANCRYIKDGQKILRRVHRVMKKNYSTIYIGLNVFGSISERIRETQLKRNMELRKKAKYRAIICVLCIWRYSWLKEYKIPKDIMKKIVGLCDGKGLCTNEKGHDPFHLGYIASKIDPEEWVDAAVDLGKSLYG